MKVLVKFYTSIEQIKFWSKGDTKSADILCSGLYPILHNEYASHEVYTWSNETLGHEKDEGIIRVRTVGAEGGKAEEGEGMFVKTLAVFTPSLSSGGAIEETRSSAAEVGMDVADVEEEGSKIA